MIFGVMGVKNFSNFRKIFPEKFFLPKWYIVEFLGKFWRKLLKSLNFTPFWNGKTLKFSKFSENFSKFWQFFEKFSGPKTPFFENFRKFFLKKPIKRVGRGTKNSTQTPGPPSKISLMLCIHVWLNKQKFRKDLGVMM